MTQRGHRSILLLRDDNAPGRDGISTLVLGWAADRTGYPLSIAPHKPNHSPSALPTRHAVRLCKAPLRPRFQTGKLTIPQKFSIKSGPRQSKPRDHQIRAGKRITSRTHYPLTAHANYIR